MISFSRVISFRNSWTNSVLDDIEPNDIFKLPTTATASVPASISWCIFLERSSAGVPATTLVEIVEATTATSGLSLRATFDGMAH